MISAQPFVFHYLRLLKFPPALYLFVTSFLLTGPDLGVLFDTYFIFTYLSQLELHNSKFQKKEDMIWYLMFVAAVIIVGHFLFYYLSCTNYPLHTSSCAGKKNLKHPSYICPYSGLLYSYNGSWK